MTFEVSLSVRHTFGRISMGGMSIGNAERLWAAIPQKIENFTTCREADLRKTFIRRICREIARKDCYMHCYVYYVRKYIMYYECPSCRCILQMCVRTLLNNFQKFEKYSQYILNLNILYKRCNDCFRLFVSRFSKKRSISICLLKHR